MVNPLTRVGAAKRWLLHSSHGAAAIAQTMVTRFFLAAVNVGTGVITARALSAHGRGEQSALLLWPALLCYLLTLGIPSAVCYCIRKEPDRTAEFFTVSVFAAFVMSLVAIGVGIVFIPGWLHAYSPSVVHGAQILMIFAPEVMIGIVLTSMLETLGKFSTANLMRWVPAVITLVWLAVLAALHVMTPFRSAFVYLAPPVLTAVYSLWVLRSYIAMHVFDPRKAMITLGSYGIRSYGIDVLATLSTQVDQVLVVGVLSASEMGVYTVALAASRVLLILYSAVVTVVFPRASGRSPDEIFAIIGRAARVSSALAVVFAAALIAAAPLLIPFMYGRSFLGAVGVAQLLTVEAFFGGLVYVLSQTFMALDRPGLVTVLQGFGLAVAVPTLLFFLPRYGLMGAAIALLISTVSRLVFLLIAYRVILKRSIPNLIVTAADVTSFRRSLRQQ
jgi:O-antigen/teichoic acid export membrane protein